jgi:hypothetical protein
MLTAPTRTGCWKGSATLAAKRAHFEHLSAVSSAVAFFTRFSLWLRELQAMLNREKIQTAELEQAYAGE